MFGLQNSGASCRMKHKNTSMSDISPPPPSRKAITFGDKRRLRVEYIGSIDIVFHG